MVWSLEPAERLVCDYLLGIIKLYVGRMSATTPWYHAVPLQLYLRIATALVASRAAEHAPLDGAALCQQGALFMPAACCSIAGSSGRPPLAFVATPFVSFLTEETLLPGPRRRSAD